MLPQVLSAYYKLKHRASRFSQIFLASPRELILDIGSGNSPYAPADVICEKFPWDDTERTAGFLHDRPLVVGDIEALPFKDQAFDFIYCAHVIEHTYRPDKAIQELMRVGKRGYIEVPTKYLEKAIHCNPGHLWYITPEQGTMVFSPKPEGVLDPDLNELHERRLTGDPLYAIYYHGRYYDYGTMHFIWEKTIPYRVEGSHAGGDGRKTFAKAAACVDLDHRKAVRNSPVARWLKQAIRFWYGREKKFALEALLACPACRGTLLLQEDSCLCKGCGKRYPLKSGIPVLLLESSESPALSLPV